MAKKELDNSPHLPKLPNPEKINFGRFKFVDYLAQVLPLTEDEMNASPEIDSPDLMLQRYLWEVCTGKMRRIRYEAAETYLSNKLLVPKHEASFQMEFYISGRIDNLAKTGPKFVRLRIYAPVPGTPINFDIYGSRRKELEDAITSGVKITGISEKH